MKFTRFKIDSREQKEMAFIMYHDPNGILAAIFASMPLALKQHCIKVGAVSGIIAEQAPDSSVPKGMTQQDYANAVRYGGFYHDLGAYLAHNQWGDYPAKGKKILEKEISKDKVDPNIRRVILETVGFCGEQFDGNGYPHHLSGRQIPYHAGVCAIADTIDNIVNGRRRFLESTMAEIKHYIYTNTGVIYLPDAAAGFMNAEQRIRGMYRTWKNSPPMWQYNDLKPVSKPYGKTIK